MTSIPPAAAHVLHANSVPAAISAQTAGSDMTRIRARCAAGPGNCANDPAAIVPNSPYVASTGLPAPYRQA
ncbi:hypothetical protein AB0B39_25720 [Micromonospora sp. NPDC049114]|uniref:hypothetical protein n=1 Tax=Micromonospora sp. NPDC049114 TaxID=3155498 RepID=UPI0033F8BE6E